MWRSVVILALLIGSIGIAHADETWRCAYTSGITNEPVLVQYDLSGQELIETSGSGKMSRYQVVQNNRYGIIGILAVSDVQPDQQRPTVSATTVVIEKTSRDFWLTTTIGGQPGALNLPVHGSCFAP